MPIYYGIYIAIILNKTLKIVKKMEGVNYRLRDEIKYRYSIILNLLIHIKII